MALGVYLTFRILNFADLTVDGSFTAGGGTAAALILAGVNPFAAARVGFAVGLVAGTITGLLHTKGGIDRIVWEADPETKKQLTVHDLLAQFAAIKGATLSDTAFLG